MEQGLTSYTSLAPWYDGLMNEVPYKRWARFIQFQIAKSGLVEPVIGDLACGTGVITGYMGRHFKVWGIDQCPDMLTKARERNPDIPFFQGSLECLSQPADVFICTCDGVNHILTLASLRAFFARVFCLLPKGGLFIFDVNSPWKYQHVLADNIFYYMLANGGRLIWQNSYSGKRNLAHLQIFLPNNKEMFSLQEALIEERCYSVSSLVYWLHKSGFSIAGIWDNYSPKSVSPTTERIVFCAQKP